MKWFYIISLLVVAAMVASPYLLIPYARRHDIPVNYSEVVIGYADDGTPITKNNPVIRFGYYRATIKSLDPATCGDTSSSGVQTHCYEGLYSYHYLKRPAEIEPLLAAELPTVSDDGLTYTIPIRRGVYYSRNECFGIDGRTGLLKTREVTAHDFVLAFKRIADYHLANGSLPQVFLIDRVVGMREYRDATEEYDESDITHYDELDIEGVKAIDDYTLQLTLSEPFPQLNYVLAMHNYAPIPHEVVTHYLKHKDLPQIRRPEEVVGTGAYLLERFGEKTPIVFVRNPDYRYTTYPTEGTEEDRLAGRLDDAGKQVPFIDIIHWDYVPETFTAWMMFLTREVDGTGISEELFDTVVDADRELQQHWYDDGIRMRVYTVPTYYYLGFNLNDPVFAASPSLRKAISLGIDVETYIEILYNGRGIPVKNCIPSTLAESDPSSYEAHTQAGQGAYYRFDPDEAKNLLVEAKKELAEAGLLQNGEIPKLNLYIPGTDTARQKMGDFFAQQFRNMGLELDVRLNDWATHQDKVGSGIAQMFLMGWAADYPDAENFLQLFYSGNYHGDGEPNYVNERFDELYERIRIMPDTPERTALYTEMTTIINEDCPARFLSEPIVFVLNHEWVKNSKPHPVGYGYAKYIRIDTERRRELGGRER